MNVLVCLLSFGRHAVKDARVMLFDLGGSEWDAEYNSARFAHYSYDLCSRSMWLWGDYDHIEPKASLVLKLELLIPGYKTHYNTHFNQILKLCSGHHNAPPTAKTQRAPHTTSARWDFRLHFGVLSHFSVSWLLEGEWYGDDGDVDDVGGQRGNNNSFNKHHHNLTHHNI
jgi:hypothetical protein